MTKKQIERIRQQITREFADRNTANRTAAQRRLDENGVTGLFEDMPSHVKGLRASIKHICSGCPTGIPTCDDEVVGFISRVLMADVVLVYEAYALRKDLTDEMIAAAGPFRNEDEYLNLFRDRIDQCSPLREHGKLWWSQRLILTLLYNYIMAMATYSRDVGAVDAAKEWLDAMSDLALIDRNQKRGWVPRLEWVERVFAAIDVARRASVREWAFAHLTSLKDIAAAVEADAKYYAKKVEG